MGLRGSRRFISRGGDWVLFDMRNLDAELSTYRVNFSAAGYMSC